MTCVYAHGRGILHKRINDILRIANGDNVVVDETVQEMARIFRKTLEQSRLGSGDIIHVVITIEDKENHV